VPDCCPSEKFRLDGCQLFLSFFLRVQISFPNKRMGKANVLYSVILENFWTRVGLKVVIKNSKHLCKILLVFVEYLFHFRRKFLQTRYLKFFTCCKHLLSTIILLLIGSCPENAIVSDFSGDSSIQNVFCYVFTVNSPHCNLSTESVIIFFFVCKKQGFYFCNVCR
jgi:hypothetical protein